MDVALVISGNSFVGRHLCRRLAQLGIAYQATSRAPQPGFLVCDLKAAHDLDRVLALARPRWVFVCSGATPQCGPHRLAAMHVTATESLLQSIVRHVPDAVTVLFGSAAEYGRVAPEQLPIREETPACPESAYGKSKLSQFELAQKLAALHKLRIHVVRPFNILGPGLGRHLVAGALCERLLQAKRQGRSGAIPIVSGQATRDWVDVRDVADAVLRLALDAPPSPGTVGLFNIATGIETPVLTLADYLCRLAGEFHAVDAGADDLSSPVDRSCGDASKLRADTGWRPRFTWQQSAEALWNRVVRTVSEPRP